MKRDNLIFGGKGMMKRATRWLFLVPFALVAFWAAVSWPGWEREAEQAAGLSARLTCSCRYIENRTLDSCKRDLSGVPWMVLVRYEDDPQARRVTSKVPMLASRSARLKPDFGCMPEA
jgi:hypothetical protein